MKKPEIRSADNSDHYIWGHICDGWNLLKSAELSVIQERMPPGSSEQLHCHRLAQQVFYILSGNAGFEIDGETLAMSSGQSIHIQPNVLHRIYNSSEQDLHFLVISNPASHGDRIEITDYSAEHKDVIKTLNYEWITKYFRVEPADTAALENPEKYILAKGGFIYYALYNGEFVGTAPLIRIDNEQYELSKMAVTEKARGLGIGNILMQHCFDQAKRKGIKRLILYSNRSLVAAIQLYLKFGFVEIPCETGYYERADIKMEKVF